MRVIRRCTRVLLTQVSKPGQVGRKLISARENDSKRRRCFSYYWLASYRYCFVICRHEALFKVCIFGQEGSRGHECQEQGDLENTARVKAKGIV